MAARVALIWAMAENRVIGLDGSLPWRLPDEMRHFMRTTRGRPVVMGRKTFDSMKRPLTGRTNFVVTSRPLNNPDVHCHTDLSAAIAAADLQAQQDGVDEVMVIGGAGIYAAALPSADRLYMTIVHGEIQGDVQFDDFDRSQWRECHRHHHPADDLHPFAFTMFTLERITAP